MKAIEKLPEMDIPDDIKKKRIKLKLIVETQGKEYGPYEAYVKTSFSDNEKDEKIISSQLTAKEELSCILIDALKNELNNMILIAVKDIINDIKWI